MKTALLAAVFTCALAIPAFAFEGNSKGQGPQGQNFEQKKTEILQHFEQKITHIQAIKACVQAAKSHDDLRACKDKYPPPQNNGHQQNHGPQNR